MSFARLLFARLVRPVVCLIAAASAVQAQSTFLYLDSQPGDYIGGGTQQTFTPLDGTFTAGTISGGGASVTLSGPTHFWNLDFVPANGQPFGTGAYVGAERYPFQSPSVPGLSVYGDGRGCNTLTGRFVVLELVRSGSTITSFAADCEQHCEGGTPALFASIRINSSLPVEPRIAIGGARVLEGDVGFTDSSFHAFLTRPASGTVTADYHTTPGTAQSGSDYVPAHGTLSLPPGTVDWTLPVLIRANLTVQGDRQFTLDLGNPSGASLAIGSATGEILDDDDGKSLLYLDSQPFDLLAHGAHYTLDSADGSFSGTLSNSHAAITFNGSDTWTVDLASPSGTPLVPGTYEGAVRYPFQPSGVPGLAVSGAGVGCNTITGRFAVLEVVMGTGTHLARFAADFEQHCEGGSAALFGSIRLHSNVAVPQQSPLVGDIDHDGSTDLVWRDQSHGFDVVEFMHGVDDAGFGTLPRIADPNWEIVGTNDWNGDGKTDQFWRNRVTGQDFILFFDGVTPTGLTVLPTVADTHWKVQATARFDGDGWPDVFWRNDATGQDAIAVMRGTSITSFQVIDPEPDLDWNVVAGADCDRNGTTDLVWHNRTTLENRVWFLGFSFYLFGTAPLVPGLPGWEIFAAGDYNRDGEVDLVWRNVTDGQSSIWFLRNHQRTGLAFLHPLTDLDWKIVGPR